MDGPPDRPANEEPSSAPPSDALGNPLPPDVPASPPPEAPPRRGVSWLGVAVAGIGLVLAVVGVASLLLSRDNGVSDLDARLAGVELDLRDLAARAPPPAADPKALDAVAGRVAKLEAAGATPPQGAVDPALAAPALNAAAERGDGLAVELAAVKALGADPKLVAALEPFARSGVPTAAALARQFSEVTPALVQAAEPPSREGVLGRLQMNAEKLVRIRRVDEAPGSDAAAIVARSEAKAARGDLAGTVAELGQLPPNARAPAEAWIKSVQARTAAIDASRRLAADALSGLSK